MRCHGRERAVGDAVLALSVTPAPVSAFVRRLLRTGSGAALLVAIMVVGSIVLWVGTPLAWLWVGGQVQGVTGSLGAALAVAFAGVILTVTLLASLLSRLSDGYRVNRIARRGEDPGHVLLESVLVVSAGVSLAVFAVWFLVFAGASPAPIGISV